MEIKLLKKKVDYQGISQFRYFFFRDTEENIILSKEGYWFAKPFNDNYSFVKENDLWQIIDQEGNNYLDTSLENESEKVIANEVLRNLVTKEHIFSKYYKTGGYFLLFLEYQFIYELCKKHEFRLKNLIELHELTLIEKSKKCAVFFDEKFVPKAWFYDANIFENDLAPVEDISGKWGFISNDFNYKINPIYEAAFPFSDGLAKVKINGKYGFINSQGNFIIPNIYDDARSFKHGYAQVATICDYLATSIPSFEYRHTGDKSLGMKWTLIDKKGEIILRNDFVAMSSLIKRKNQALEMFVGKYNIANSDFTLSQIKKLYDLNMEYSRIDLKGNLIENIVKYDQENMANPRYVMWYWHRYLGTKYHPLIFKQDYNEDFDYSIAERVEYDYIEYEEEYERQREYGEAIEWMSKHGAKDAFDGNSDEYNEWKNG